MTEAGGSLLWRAVRWRAGMSLLTVVLASVAVLAAALGPLYLRAASDSVTRTAVSAAAVQDSGATVQGRIIDGSLSPVGARAVAAGAEEVDAIGAPHRFYGAPLTTITDAAYLSGGRGRAPFLTTIEARTGLCAHLTFEVGTCPTRVRGVAVSTRTAHLLGIHEGEQLPVGLHRGSVTERVVGQYLAPPNLATSYWWGQGRNTFPYGTTVHAGTFVDPLVGLPATALDVPATAESPTVVAQVPLLPGSVHVGTVGALRHGLAEAAAGLGRRHLAAYSSIGTILVGISHQEHLMTVIVLVVAAQLLLLALWVLASLIAESGEARAGEVRLARLLGQPRRSVVAVASAEPAVLCLAGVPIGLVLAWLATVVLKDLVLTAGTTVAPDGFVVVATGAAILGAAGAIAVGARRLLRRPVLEAAPVMAGGWRSRAGQTADVAVAVLAVVGLVELTTTGVVSSGHTDPLASVAPSLITVGIGIVGVRALLAVGGTVVRATRWSRHVVVFLVARQLTRRPLLLRQVRVLVVAVGLACFATATFLVADANRARVAGFTVGANTVVTVSPTPTVDPIAAVDRLDPSGRRAMAVAVVRTPSTTLLGVDPSRLGAVADWSDGVSATTLARITRLIAPHTAPVVALQTASLRVVTDTSFLVAAGTHLAVYVYDERFQDVGIVDLGALRPGRQTHIADVSGYCADRCRLDGLSVVATGDGAAANHPVPFAITIASMAIRGAGDGRGLAPSAWRPLGADLGRPDSWVGAAGAGISVTRVAAGYRFGLSADALSLVGGGLAATVPPLFGPADLPATLPGVVTTTVLGANGGGSIPVEGLDVAPLSVRSVASATGLPAVGVSGVMVDLRLLESAQTTVTSAATSWQVWLAPHASTLVDRLPSVGLHVVSVQRASTVRRLLGRSGPALTLDFFLAAAGLSVLLAVIATLASLISAVRRRAKEIVVVAAAGVPRRVLGRALVAETIVLAAGCLLGAAGGIAAAAIALSSIPELAVVPPVPPLGYALPLPALAALVAGVLVVTVTAGVVAVTVTVRRAQPDLLRMTVE